MAEWMEQPGSLSCFTHGLSLCLHKVGTRMPWSFHDHEGFIITSGARLGSMGTMCGERQQRWAVRIPIDGLASGTHAPGKWDSGSTSRETAQPLTPGRKSQGTSVKVSAAQSCPTLCDPLGCSLPGSSVHGILQARTLEWVAVPFSRGSSQPGDRPQVSCTACRFSRASSPATGVSEQASNLCRKSVFALLRV